MALLEIEMARIEEVFLPYMFTQNGETFFEATQREHFQLSGGTNAADGEVIEAA